MEAIALPSHDAIALLANSALVTPRATTLPPLRHKRQFSQATVTPVKRRKVTKPVLSPLPSSSINTALSIPPSMKSGLCRPNMTASNTITLDMLRPHFEEPLAKVAANFGICVTLLKKICRRHGIARWPHRQITGLRKSISSMEHAITFFDGARRESYAEQLLKQKKKLLALLDDPTINNPLLAKEDEVANGFVKASPLHGTERGHDVKPDSSIRAMSPRSPLLVESPHSASHFDATPIQTSSMSLPAPHFNGHPYTPGHNYQPYFPHISMQSSPEVISDYVPGASNEVPRIIASSAIPLPPLRRPMLPSISSLVAGNYYSFDNRW